MAAAATLTKPQTSTTSSTSSFVKKDEHPDRFFGRVRTCLEANQLPKALEILRLGNSSIHRNLVPSNIETVAAFLSVEKETPEKTVNIRCARLTKIMQQHFPDVFQLELIKKKGLEAGLTAEEIEQSLTQVVLNDGSFWMIGESHEPRYSAWGRSLTEMAGNNAINFWAEGTERSSSIETQVVLAKTGNRCSSRGLFRGLENVQSIHWSSLMPSYFELFTEYVLTLIALRSNPFTVMIVKNRMSGVCIPFLGKLLNNSITYRTVFFKAIGETAHHSSIAKSLMHMIINVQNNLKGQVILPEVYQKNAANLFSTIKDLMQWPSFLEEHLPNVFADCTPEVQAALKELIASGNRYKELLAKVEFNEDADASQYDPEPFLKKAGFHDAWEKFLAAFRPVRDTIFANSFWSEWPNRNKDVISIVYFGKNHAEGFKREVIARQEEKSQSKENKKRDEGKAENKGDSKADSKTGN